MLAKTNRRGESEEKAKDSEFAADKELNEKETPGAVSKKTQSIEMES